MRALLLCCLISCVLGAVRLKLSGNYSELFFWIATIKVGGVPFTVTIDTGSSDLLVPQLGCSTCFGGDPSHYYNVTSHLVPCASSLALNCMRPCAGLACNFSVTYGGSLTEYASAVQDTVTLGSALGAVTGKVTFGATYNVVQQNSFRRRQRGGGMLHARQQAGDYPEGIWGLAFQKINGLGVPPMLDLMVAQNRGRLLPRNAFQLCLQQVGGLMVAGEDASTKVKGWTSVRVLPNNGFWQVPFANVTANGVGLGVASSVYNNPGIVDTGTPFFTLPTPAFNNLKQILLANCSRNNLVGLCNVPSNATFFEGQCFSLSPAQIAQFPTLTVSFEGASGTMAVTPSMYLIPLFSCNAPGQVGMAIVPDPTFTVISGNVLLHFHTYYDKDKLQWQFAPRSLSSTCDI